MPRKILFLTGIICALILAGCAKKPESGEPRRMPDIRPPDTSTAIEIPQRPYPVIPNELVVLLKEGQTVQSFSKTIEGRPIKIVGSIPEFRVVQVEVPADQREKIKEELGKNPAVEVVVYQSIFEPKAAFNDPALTNNDPRDDWGLWAMRLPEAWEITRGSKDVVIGVVDAGVLFEHEELKGKIINSASLYTEDGSHTGDAQGLEHGTHVAITAAGYGNNGVGTSGVAPECPVMPVQVGGTASVSDILAAISYTAENGAKVINLSMAPTIRDYIIEDYPDPAQRQSMRGYLQGGLAEDLNFANKVFGAAQAKGVTVVVAAGNDTLPGDLNPWVLSPYTLGVGAAGIDPDGNLAPAEFSNYGYMVRVCAPGLDIYSGTAEQGGKGYGLMSGTSMAAPHVSGVAALIASKYPKLTPQEVRQVIIASSMPQTPAESPHLRWFGSSPRAINQEMDLWKRALMRILKKDEQKLLDDFSQYALVSLVPADYNLAWNGPFQPIPGTGRQIYDMAIGGLVDARKALEFAESGEFRKMFVQFNKEDYDKISRLTSADLLRVHDLLKYEGSYAGSAQTGGPFRLIAKEPFDKLEVIREQIPGSDYSEWLEYVEPGVYMHFASFGGEDYRQGRIKLAVDEKGALVMENIRRKETVSYEKSDEQISQPAAPERFCAVAGGCEPNTVGRLLITYLGPEDKIEEREYWVFPKGGIRDVRNVVFPGKTGKEDELLTGEYDIVILSKPPISLEGVVIEKDKTAAFEAGGYGALLVKLQDYEGNLPRYNIFIYPAGEKKNAVATRRTNEEIRVPAGRYDLYIDMNPDTLFENVDIKRAEKKEIVIPQLGALQINTTDSSGASKSYFYWLYAPDNHNDMLTPSNTNKIVHLPAATYDVLFYRGGWIEGVTVKEGQLTTLKKEFE